MNITIHLGNFGEHREGPRKVGWCSISGSRRVNYVTGRILDSMSFTEKYEYN